MEQMMARAHNVAGDEKASNIPFMLALKEQVDSSHHQVKTPGGVQLPQIRVLHRSDA